jgi:phosphoglucosamine mutase
MGRLFGTDGVRGIANTELLPELAFKLGKAGAYVLTKTTKHKPKILIAKDTRISGDMLEASLVSGICSAGAKARLLGVLPTPAVAYLVREYNADAGVVISASHNPMEHNGIKFFDRNGYKLSDALEDEIERVILSGMDEIPSITGDQIGKIKTKRSSDYIDFALKSIDCDLDDMKIVVDCANGAASSVAPMALEELEANMDVIHNDPNGININDGCGSTHMEDLCARVKSIGADVGIAFDGDADRLLAVDENGSLVDGDIIMMILAIHYKSLGRLKKNTLVATVMSNMGLFIAAKEHGINVVKTAVGDRYVLEEMLKNDYSLGGEQSGHIIIRDYNTTGDGLVTALQLLSVMKKTGKKLSELAKCMTILPQVLVNIAVLPDKKMLYVEDPEIQAKIHEAETILGERGRVLVRPSGTENLLRIMIEGENHEQINTMANDIAQIAKERLS